MSNKVDERITRIRFDNDQFERGVATSMQSLDRLKNKLESTESSSGFSGMGKAVEGVASKFTFLEHVAAEALGNIATEAIHAGTALVKSLSTDNIAAGWSKYNEEVSAVQAMLHTLGDTASIEDVEEHLKYISWYSDETSYSYTQMSNALGRFVNNGAKLDVATLAMTGFANAAAAAGVSTQKAGTVFEVFSDAYARGYMMLRDWRRLEGLLMTTPEFKQNLLDVAVGLGKIKKAGDDLYSAPGYDDLFTSGGLSMSLSKGKWLDKDVILELAKLYGDYSDQIYKFQQVFSVDTASDAMDYLSEIGSSEFRNRLLDTAASLGKIYKAEDGVFYLTKEMLSNEIVSSSSMLYDKWFDSAVLTEALKRYDDIGDAVRDFQEARGFDTIIETMKYMDEMGIKLDTVSDKAFHMGQEAKTLAEALESVQDAVSTKWKDTFKLIFGNYLEAKDLWTDLANDLYDLFAASGDVRNEILEQWNDPLSFMVPDEKVRKAYKFPELEAGRDILVKGLYNIFESIVNVVTAIKEAWREVFPQITAKKLYELTKSFRDFTERIKNSTKNLEGFKNFLVGAFGIFRTVLNGVKKFIGFLKQLWPIAKKVGSILKVIGEQVIQFFKDAADYIHVSDKLKDGIGSLRSVFERFKNTILNFDEKRIKLPTFKEFLSTIEKVKAALTGFRNKISDVFYQIKDKVKQFLPESVFNNISSWALGLGDIFKNLSVDLRPTLDNISGFFTNMWSVISKVLSAIGKGVKSVADWIKNQFAGIGLRDILGVGVLGVMSWFTIRLGIMAGRIGELLENISDLIWSFSKAVNAKAFEIRLEGLKQLGLAVLALAGALYLISKISDPGRFAQAVISVAVMTGALVAISIFMAKLESKLKLQGTGIGVTYTKEKGLALNGGLQRRGVTGLVIGVLGMVWAVRLMADMMNDHNLSPDRLNSLAKMVSHIAFVLTACSVAMQFAGSMATKFAGGKFNTATFAPIAMASAMLVMIRVFEKLDAMKIENVTKVLVGIFGIIMTMALFSLALKKINTGTGLGMLGIVTSLYLVLFALEKLSKMDIDLSGKGPILAILGGLLLVLGLIEIFANKSGTVLKKGERFRRNTSSMVGIIFGLIACVSAIEILGKMDRSDLIQGGLAALGIMVVLFAGMTVMIAAANKAGQYAGRGLLAISVLMIVVTLMFGLVSIITYIDPNGWYKSLAVIAVMLGGIALICAALNKKEFKTQSKAIWAVFAIILGLGGIITALYLFSKEDSDAALNSVNGLAALMIGLGAMIALIGTSTNDSLISGARQILTNIAILLAELGLTVVALSYTIKDADAALKGAAAMGILALAMGGMVSLIGKIPIIQNPESMVMNLGGIALVSIALGGVVIALSRWVNGDNLSWIDKYGLQVGAALFAVGLLAFGISEMGRLVDLKAAQQGFLVFLEATGIIMLIAAVFFGLDTALHALANETTSYEDLRERIRNLPELARDIGTAVGGLYEGLFVGNLPDMAERLSDFSEKLQPFIDQIGSIPDGFFGKLTSVFAGVAEFLGTGLLTVLMDSPLGSKMLLKKLETMGQMFDEGSLFAKIRDFGDTSGIEPGINLIKAIGPAVTSLNDAKFKNLESDIYPALNTLAINMKTFGDSLDAIDEGTMEKIGWISATLQGIGSAIESFYSEYGGVYDLETISDQIEYLGTGVNSYLTSVTNISEDDIEKTQLVYRLLHGLLKINDDIGLNKAGVQQWFSGWTDFGQFGKDLGTFVTEGLKTYLGELSSHPISYFNDIFTKTPFVVNIIKQIASLGAVIGENRGLDVFITGNTDYGKFGTQLGKLASGIMTYSKKLTLTKERAQELAEITNLIADALNNLYGDSANDNITKFIDSLKRLAEEGINAFTSAFEGSDIYSKMVGAIQNMTDQFGKAAEWVGTQTTYIYNQISPVFAAIFEAIRTFTLDMYNKGKEFFGSFIDGMLDTGNVDRLKNGIKDAVGNGEFIEDGLAKGIEKGTNAVVGAVHKVNKAAQDMLHIDWEIESPSKVAQRDGYYIGMGMANGITRASSMVVDAIHSMNLQSNKEMEEGMGDAIVGVIGAAKDTVQDFKGTISGFVGDLLGNILPEGTLNDIVSFLNGKFDGFLGDLSTENLLSGIQEYMTDYFDGFDAEGDFSLSNLLNYDDMMAEWQAALDEYSAANGFELGITPVITDDSEVTDWVNSLSGSGGSIGGTVAGYTSEDVRNLTAEIYHLEDALYSLKEAMKNQQITHSGELTIHYSNESDFVDRIQTALIGEIRREVRG